MKPAPANPALLTVAGAASVLGVSTRSAWRLVGSGELPSLMVGRRLRRVATSDIEVYIALQREGSRRQRRSAL
jgi:excisionase family DNA binding protein